MGKPPLAQDAADGLLVRFLALYYLACSTPFLALPDLIRHPPVVAVRWFAAIEMYRSPNTPIGNAPSKVYRALAPGLGGNGGVANLNKVAQLPPSPHTVDFEN